MCIIYHVYFCLYSETKINFRIIIYPSGKENFLNALKFLQCVFLSFNVNKASLTPNVHILGIM